MLNNSDKIQLNRNIDQVNDSILSTSHYTYNNNRNIYNNSTHNN